MPSLFPAEFGFYGILTDPVRGYGYCTELMVARKVAVVQLRMKDAAADRVLETARLMRSITRGTSTRFVVNDFPDIAVACGADGVHVGQGDMPYEQVRRMVGSCAAIGLSTHNPGQMTAACALNPDYVGVGPVYATPTKKIPDPPLGLRGMKEMLDLATVPVVVLGSIGVDNLDTVLKTGARNFACVRPINLTSNPDRELDRILEIVERFRERVNR